MAESTKGPAAAGPKGENNDADQGKTKPRDVRRERITAAAILTAAFLASVLISWQSGQKVQDAAEMLDE